MRLVPTLPLCLASLGLVAVMSGGAGCSEPKRPDGTSGLIQPGASAPDFEAQTSTGSATRLSLAGGKPRVVYFYPKDDTPGCTKEACAFRDAFSKYEAEGVVVYGVSNDSRESHEAFAKKHHLPFALVSDSSGDLARAYGVPVHMGMPKRVTFLVGRDGKIARVFPEVDPAIHAGEVLAAAASLPK